MNASLNFIFSYKNKFKYIVVGLENIDQLKKITHFKKKKNLKNFQKISIKNKRFFSPTLLKGK